MMDLLKLLPLLFVAASGDARAIHQQLLPAIPGYVPVYIQQGPDVQVIYETGRRAAVVAAEQPAKPAEHEVLVPMSAEEVLPPKAAEIVPMKSAEEILPPKEAEAVLPPKAVEEVLPVNAAEEAPPTPAAPEGPKEVLPPVKEPEDSPEVKHEMEDKKDSEEHNSIRQEGSRRLVGSGSVVLVPGYHADDK